MKTLKQLNDYSTATIIYTDQTLGNGQSLTNRYQINGLIDTSRPVLQNIESLTNAAGSWLGYDIHEGKWGIIINKSETSIASFNDSNILGNITVNGTGLKDLYNSAKATFPHRDLQDSPDFVSTEIPVGDRHANEQTHSLGLTYDIVNEPVQAQLLSFIELKQGRIDLVINFVADYSYISLKAGDVIDVTDSRFGFTNKLFRIVSIAEVQDGMGPLELEITALEYDETVYDTTNLYRYTRTNADGIITIGSIGAPGTPQVTKFEAAARPSVLIESTAPTGIVEVMEFWISTDVLAAEENRTYTILGEVKPVNGGVFPSGQTVRLDYDNLNSVNFVVKTRGRNSTTVGPYSNLSGFTEFNPLQITQAVGPNTKTVDALGNVVTALAVIDLLKGLDGLYQKSFSTSSVFTKIFETFKEYTGIDLVGQAKTGGLVPPPLTVRDEGTLLSTSATIINFIGDGVVASKSGDTINVVIGGTTTPVNPPANTPTINSGGIVPAYGPVSGGTIVTISGTNLGTVNKVTFGGTEGTNLTVVNSTTVKVTTPAHTEGSTDIVITNPDGSNTYGNYFTYIGVTGFITLTNKYPPDRTTYRDPITNDTSDQAPITGSYYLKFGGRAFYGELNAGSGSARLYKSDGTLVQTLNASSFIFNNDVVEMPFSKRELGTDYYILVDQGAIKYCSAENIAIDSPSTWNFNTPLYETSTYSITPGTIASLVVTATITSVFPVGADVCRSNKIALTHDNDVVTGAGNIYIKNYATDATIATIPGNTGVASGNTITYPNTLAALGVNYSTQYYITADAGYAITSVPVDCYSSAPTPTRAITGKGYNGTTRSQLLQTGFKVESLPLTDTSNNKVNPQTNIGLYFNRPIYFGTGTISIFDSAGTLHQTIDVKTSFESNKTNELIWIDNSTTATLWMNPTRDLSLGKTYYVTAQADTITDGCESWAGITNTSIVRFGVDPGPTSTNSALPTQGTTVTLTYDRPIAVGTGTIKVYNSANQVIATIPNNDPSISYS
jgi:hypothetical protein